jgi:hypothetical protein
LTALLDDGFLLSPDPARGLRSEDLKLWRFEEISDHRCLILVGEPGIGKSDAISREAELIEERCAEGEDEWILRVDLGSTREEGVLRDEIFGSQAFREWADGEGEFHLFLDSFDEAVVRLGLVGELILKGLRDADTSRLRLRLACRSSDRMLDFEQSLAELWGEGESATFELAPLTRADVILAADGRGLDAGSFIEDLRKRDIVALAIKPVTLKMLLELAGDEAGLPKGQLELYERGLALLAAEPSERRRRDRDTGGALSPWQRLALAGRLGAATVLGGRPMLATDAATAGSADRVAMSELVGREHDEGDGRHFDVGEAELREVLDTGLFAARGENLGWAHQTYGEFLAARYLARSGAASAQIDSLLVGKVGDGRVVPQLRDVAGWLAAMDAEFFDRLAVCDPLVLLRGEIALAGSEQRLRLAAALLEEDTAGEVERFDNRSIRNLVALHTDGLSGLVDKRLTDRSLPRIVRELACEIAELCELTDLEEALLGIALERAEDPVLRQAAVRTLAEIGSNCARTQLVPLARDPLPEDQDDQIKGWALRAVCPRVVSAVEALAFLTPRKRRNFTGSYSMFVSYQLPKLIKVDELPEALEWARQAPGKYDPLDDLGNLAEGILEEGAKEMGRPEVLAALASVVVAWLSDQRPLQGSGVRDGPEAFSAPERRRTLIEALVPLIGAGELEVIDVATSTPSLISAEELPWLIERLTTAVGGEEEPAWADLVSWVGARNRAEHDMVMKAREVSEVLRDLTTIRYGAIELDSAAAQRLRDHHARDLKFAERRRRITDSAPDYDANIAARLEHLREGEIEVFWGLDIDLWGEPGVPEVRLGGSDLTQSPGWQRADPQRRAEIGTACLAYLRGFPPSEDWLEGGKSFYPARSGYRALRYIHEHHEEGLAALDDETFGSWAVAVLTFNGAGEDDDGEAFLHTILEQLANRCPDALTRTARLAVLAEAAHGEGHVFVLHRVQSLLEGPLGAQLLELWKEEKLRPLPQASLLEYLLRAGIPGTLEAGLKRIDSGLIERNCDRATALAVALLTTGGAGAWALWSLLGRHDDWATEVFTRVAMGREGDLRTELAEDDLADLFIFLSERFPPADDPDRQGFRTLGPRDAVADYRDGVLNIVIERGSNDSLAALGRIEAALGEHFPYARIRAEENQRLKAWEPPRPKDVVELLERVNRRIVISDDDLQRVLVEELGCIGESLAAGGQASQLWDTSSGRPKKEVEISAWLADRLRDGLNGRGIVINREVEVTVSPTGGLGPRTDIHVDAIAGERVEGAEQVTVVIEVKGSWNRELRRAMRGQLAELYLTPSRRCGIYLVVWFDATGWTDETDSRLKASARRDREETMGEMRSQANDLHGEGYLIEPLILDGSLQPRHR